MADFTSGEFYGTRRFDVRLPGLGLSHFAATTPEHEVEEHSHDGAHLVLATRGRYITSAHGADREGPVLVYNPPGVVHRDRFEGDGGWFFAVSLDGFMDDSRPVIDAVRLSQPQAMRCALRLLHMAGDPASTRLDLESLTLEVLDQVAPDTHSAACPSWLRQAQTFIADMAGSDIGVADVAAAAGVHRVYLARQYRHWLGCSPGDDLRRRRIERAADLIMTTRDSLSDIAASAGYCDQSHLNRALAKHWGVTPAELMRLIPTGAV